MVIVVVVVIVVIVEVDVMAEPELLPKDTIENFKGILKGSVTELMALLLEVTVVVVGMLLVIPILLVVVLLQCLIGVGYFRKFGGGGLSFGLRHPVGKFVRMVAERKLAIGRLYFGLGRMVRHSEHAVRVVVMMLLLLAAHDPINR